MDLKQIDRNDRQDTPSCQSLKTPVSKIFNSIDPRAREVRPWRPWAIDMNTGVTTTIFPHALGEEGFALTSDETAKYLRIISQAPDSI